MYLNITTKQYIFHDNSSIALIMRAEPLNKLQKNINIS